MKAADWIDRLKAERNWESDYRVAKELEVGRSAISRYRSDPDSTMDEEIAIRLAEKIGERPEVILLDQMTERTRSAPVRAALRGILEGITGKKNARRRGSRQRARREGPG